MGRHLGRFEGGLGAGAGREGFERARQRGEQLLFDESITGFYGAASRAPAQQVSAQIGRANATPASGAFAAALTCRPAPGPRITLEDGTFINSTHPHHEEAPRPDRHGRRPVSFDAAAQQARPRRHARQGADHAAGQDGHLQADPKAKAHKGDERKAFMKECLSASKQVTQQNKMKTCNADPKAKALKGDERKAFMKECLSGKPA